MGLVLAATSSRPATAAPTPDELACQQATSKGVAAFVVKEIRCLVACDRRALRGKAQATDCLPPFAGAARACIDKAASKARERIAARCAADCPECYTGGDCAAHADGLLADAGATLAAVVAVVRCDDSASPDGLTKTEAKVRQKAALVVGVFTASYEKCLAGCRRREGAGRAAPGSCEALAETDAKTIACLIRIEEKAFKFLDDPEIDAPECLAPELDFAPTIAVGNVAEFDPRLFCSSPSGAFIE
jgi:hypothetical protein